MVLNFFYINFFKKIFFLFIFLEKSQSKPLLEKIKNGDPIPEEDLLENLKILRYIHLIKSGEWELNHMLYILEFPIYIVSFRKLIEEKILMMKDGPEKMKMIHKLLWNSKKFKTNVVTSSFKYLCVITLLRKKTILLEGLEVYELVQSYLKDLFHNTVNLSFSQLNQLNNNYNKNSVFKKSEIDINKRFIFLLSKNNIKKAEETTKLKECSKKNKRIISRILFLEKNNYKPKFFHTIEEFYWYIFKNYKTMKSKEFGDLLIEYEWILKSAPRKYDILKKNILAIFYKTFPLLVLENYENLEKLMNLQWISYEEKSIHGLCYLKGLYYFSKEDYKRSLLYFQQALAKHEFLKERAKYSFWIANSFSALGEKEKALKQYTITADLYIPYYSTMSAHLINKKLPVKSINQLTIDKKTNKDDWYFSTLKILGEGDKDFLTFLSYLNNLNLDLLLVVTEEKINLLKTFSQLKNHGYITILGDKIRNITGLILRESYLIIDYLNSYNLPTRLLLYSILRRESYGRYTHNLSSYANAKGVMQLKIETARTLCKRHSIPFCQNRLLTDVKYNISIGEKCLKELNKIFKGELFFIIPAYNAGSPKVLTWKKQINLIKKNEKRKKHLDCFLFVELIPFTDTKSYTKEVIDTLLIMLDNFFSYKTTPYKTEEQEEIKELYSLLFINYSF